ncbi:kanamycin kinase/aminoglycoside 3'-phosphotransferase-2 [Nocardiopsis composta]|uniref:Kanamycin kinase/aminoglycoside 3'-phosphotransferase-2 n=1 Tax=Nocardiopsis composta TaxID=157465 RepID=A0A7W8QHN8_9ACTN|nr:APH(3') family aminoglycoside O-phosphotransferase [Nocardiopsis composta]MBB5430663.1 kanamycin kinase/aminoglycoside 3'-phosphotransferase-2 [Nocardiopsis composta]
MIDSVRRRLRRRHLLYSWTRVSAGASGDEVWRLSGRLELYAKISADPAELAAEAERARWLTGAGVPAPEPVDQGERDGVGWLVSTAVPGRPVSADWPAHLRAPVVAAFARLARRLHDLPAGSCPFERGLDTAAALARKRVAAGAVDPGDFDEERRDHTPEQALAELEARRPAEPAGDAVVCHGDLTGDNVLVDPATLEWTGVVDTARLGVSDRHRDLAPALRDLDDQPYGPSFARAFAHHYGDHLLDAERLAYYRLLDEFF